MQGTTENRGMICQFDGSTAQPTMMMVDEVMPYGLVLVEMVGRDESQGLHEDTGGAMDDHRYEIG